METSKQRVPLTARLARLFWRECDSFDKTQINRILVVKLCSIGDVLFVTPTLRALKKAFPDSHIAYMVGSWAREVIQDNPHIDELIVFDAPLLKCGRIEKLWRSLKLIRVVRKKRFDMALVGHRNSLMGILVSLMGIPVRVGFDYCGMGFAFNRRVHFDSVSHEVDRYLALLDAVGVKSDGLEMEMTVGANEAAWARSFFEENSIDPGATIVLHPGGGTNPGTTMYSKRWHAEGFAEIARRAYDEFGLHCILVGGPGDDEPVGRVEDLVGEHVTILLNSTLGRLAAVLQKCRLLVCNDSGYLHIAAAVGTPTVSLFGPTDPDILAPRGDNHVVFTAHQDCSPCYSHEALLFDNRIECVSHKCMNSISIDQVWSLVTSQLARCKVGTK